MRVRITIEYNDDRKGDEIVQSLLKTFSFTKLDEMLDVNQGATFATDVSRKFEMIENLIKR